MLENIELEVDTKKNLKIISAEKDTSMKDLVLGEAKKVIDNNLTIPVIDRAENYSSLIIDVDADTKKRIKNYCNNQEVRLRDFWVECVNRILEEGNDD